MPDTTPQGRHGIPILSLCQDVHMTAQGSHAWSDTELSDAISSLQAALAGWTPSLSHTTAFDTTVRQLIEIAIDEGQTFLTRTSSDTLQRQSTGSSR